MREKSSINDFGFSIVSMSIILGIMLVFGITLVTYAIRSGVVSKFYSESLASVQIAEAGIEKALFCLNADNGDNCGGVYGASYVGEVDVNFSDGHYSTVISGTGPNRTIESTGTNAIGTSRTVSVKITNIPPTDNPDFSFALQAGQGGAYLSNNSEVVGTIYTSGDIDCQSTNATIDGDAYSSKVGGEVYKCQVNYHAHADSILSSTVDGDGYYDSDTSGSNIKGTEYPGSSTPEPQDLPELNLDFWRAAAEAGGVISGDYEPSDGESLGSKKINGDLILNNNVDIILTGPIWLTGDFTMFNGSSITLDASFGQYGTVILADHQGDPSSHGRIDLVNGSEVNGSGDPKSHVLIASTNTSTDPGNPALNISNNAAGAIFLAIDGIMVLNNLANAKSMAAYRLYLGQNAVVTYIESELSDMKFSNSPGITWHLLENSWMETD